METQNANLWKKSPNYVLKKHNIFNPLKPLLFQKDKKCDAVMKSVQFPFFPIYSENGYFLGLA